MPDSTKTLSAEQIEAAVLYVENASKVEQHAKKSIYKNVAGEELTIRRIKVILDRRWLTDDVSATSNSELIKPKSLVFYDNFVHCR